MNYDKLGGNTDSRKRSLADLKPAWPKGVSGNPSGRLPSLYQKKLEDMLNNTERVPHLVEAAYQRMLTNTMVGAIELRNSKEFVDGLVKQEIELSGEVRNLSDEDLHERLARAMANGDNRTESGAPEQGTEDQGTKPS